MRISKTCGAPCDRRMGRGKVAMAAMAALLLFATTAQAQTDFTIDGNQSYMSRVGTGFQPTNPDGSFSGPFLANAPQDAGLVNPGSIPGGSMNAQLFGNLYAVVNPGSSIQLLSGQLAEGAGNSGINMHVATTGLYQPGQDGAGNISTVGSYQGNFGHKNAAVAAKLRDSDWSFDSTLSMNPTFTAPAALATDGSGNFDVHGTLLPTMTGVEDIISGISSPTRIHLASDFGPLPLDFNNGPGGVGGFQPAGTVVGNIDPVTFHLVLPINLQIWSKVKSSGVLLGFFVSAFGGQIVADPAVPEPSTITLFGFGIIGLLSYAWRARKRKALVA
ncbi:MAG: PEP-CTERM sorting domain-containing protein [Planctomycetia bacterium]|nr:PEP-CTERM sorting domain-containing protein [Planctomycetia bacterium]